MVGDGLIPAIEYKQLTNKVYKLIVPSRREKSKDNPNNIVYLREDRNRFNMPSKLYGDYYKNAYHIFNYFKTRGVSVGSLFVGDAGTGKTLLAELICNLAMDELNYPVIYCGSETDVTEDAVLPFLSKLDKCCIFLDEFGKTCRWYGSQDKFLSLLTDRSKNILWLFTENSLSGINEYLLHRPGRIRYLINFNKLPVKVIEEYCEDHGVSNVFKDELLDVYQEAEKFSFDYLESIVSEHKYVPTFGINEIIELMNVKSLITSRFLVVSSLKYLDMDIIPAKFKFGNKNNENNGPAEDKGSEVSDTDETKKPLNTIFGPGVGSGREQEPLGLDKDMKKIGSNILWVRLDLLTTRYSIPMSPVAITDFKDSGRRGDKDICKKVAKGLVGQIYNPKDTDMIEKLDISYKNSKTGFKIDKQLFAALRKGDENNKPYISLEIERREARIKLAEKAEVKDINDRDFDIKEFLKEPFVYGDKKNKIEPLSNRIKDPKERFVGPEFDLEFCETEEYFGDYSFSLKNKWFKITFSIVDGSGMFV